MKLMTIAGVDSAGLCNSIILIPEHSEDLETISYLQERGIAEKVSMLNFQDPAVCGESVTIYPYSLADYHDLREREAEVESFEEGGYNES